MSVIIILPDEKRKYLAESFQETTTDQSFQRRNELGPFLWIRSFASGTGN